MGLRQLHARAEEEIVSLEHMIATPALALPPTVPPPPTSNHPHLCLLLSPLSPPNTPSPR